MYKFGEIYMAALPVAINSNIQQGTRPVIIVSNDKNNCFSTVVNVTINPNDAGRNEEWEVPQSNNTSIYLY